MSETSQTIPNGVSSNGITFFPGTGQQEHYVVLSGGSMSDDVFNGTGIYGGIVVVVSSGGVANQDTFINAALQFWGGSVNGLIASSGGSIGTDSGTATNITVWSAGNFGNAGTVENLTVNNGGSATNSGEATQVVVNGGGTYAEDGTGTGTVVNASAAEVVYGSAVDTKVLGGNVYADNSGEVLGGTFGSGSFLGLSGGGFVSGAGFTDSELRVGGGGSAVDVTLDGGTLVIPYNNVNAQVSGATVADGGRVTVTGYELRNYGPTLSALAYDTTLDSGTAMTLEATLATGIAVASNTVVDGGASVFVGDFSTLAYGTISSGGYAVISAGGTISETTVNSGGTVVLLAGATQSGLNALSGSIVLSGGLVVESGGVLTTATTSTLSGLPVGSGVADYVYSGGTVVSTAVTNGGQELVFSGGVADFTALTGGTETVGSGGVARFATVGSGAGQTVESGGTASGTTLSGYQVVYPGAVVSGDVVMGGGAVYLDGTGIASGGVIESGGGEYIYSGGSGLDAVVSDGGKAFVYSGGSAVSFVVSDGGIESVSSGGLATLTEVMVGGSIDLPNLAYSGSQPTMSGNLLTITEGAETYQQLLAGNYAGTTFVASQDASQPILAGAIPDEASAYATGSGGTGTVLVLQAVSCFCRGTAIRTDRGEVPVERLRIGDMLPTRPAGVSRPVVWIGQREVDCARHPHPASVWPVRVSAGAFGPNLPRVDLFLSPDHAVFVDGVLVPVHLLVNESTIARVKRDRVTYLHVELPDHAIILAEGLPVESYLDTGDRANFHPDGGVAVNLFPNFVRVPDRDVALAWETRGAAPLVLAGNELAAARRTVECYAGQSGGGKRAVGSVFSPAKRRHSPP